MAVTIQRRVMTLRELWDMHAVRKSLARDVSSWPKCVAGGVVAFSAPTGWYWHHEKGEPVLRMHFKPWRIIKEMWQQDRQELGLDDEEEPMANNSDVPQREFGQLINLITAVIDKPLTSWQRKQLDRWEDAIHRNPPPFDPVLKVGVNAETREKAHQIGRIMDVTGTEHRSTAEKLYASGMRIIEQD